MGTFRLGFLVKFLSHPVISGFTSAAALIIGFSQLKHLLGISLGRSLHVHTIIWEALEKIAETNLITVSIGFAVIVFIVLLKTYFKKIPVQILAWSLVFQSYPVTGGFSRTAVNDQAGAKTTMASVISASIVALTLLFLTPLFYYLPKAILASVIMLAVFSLIDFKEAKFL